MSKKLLIALVLFLTIFTTVLLVLLLIGPSRNPQPVVIQIDSKLERVNVKNNESVSTPL